ncbi:MAG: diacylglycerol kinase family protein [Oscillospiraceae bacterium]|nr:diacylglycerol kinase family protein [Oscillospiraceae bacterium]
MNTLTGLIKSFGYAGRGIAYAVTAERNMRIHICAVVFVIICGLWQGLSPGHWAIQLICCGAVTALELVNTALERLCDGVTEERRAWVMRCKDAAAAAVLVMAAAAAAVWLVMLLCTPEYRRSFAAHLSCAGGWITAALWAALSAAFVFCVKYRDKRGAGEDDK